MMTFWEWVCQRPYVPPRVLHSNQHELKEQLPRLVREGDEGHQAFLDQTNGEFRKMIGTILHMGKFTDPRNEAEARAIVADTQYFNYAQELVGAARGGRARLQGQDVLDAAQDANVQLWMNLLSPKLYEPEGVTWGSRNPFSAARGGIRGTVRSWARNKAGHSAARIHKRRAGVTVRHFSQIHDPDNPFDPPARPQMSELEWDDLKRAIIDGLETQLRKESETQGPHWQSRVRNLRWAVEIVRRQMAIPWEWRSMPEIAGEMPESNAKLRGGLADQLKRRIDLARRKALGEGNQGALRYAPGANTGHTARARRPEFSRPTAPVRFPGTWPPPSGQQEAR
jgi:hypothetical protein